MAYAFCNKALELEPQNPDLLEVTGQVEMELEKFAEARQVCKISWQKEEGKGGKKWNLSKSEGGSLPLIFKMGNCIKRKFIFFFFWLTYSTC